MQLKYMKASLKNDCLNLLFPERIDTGNSATIQKELTELLVFYRHKKVIADFDQVKFISSMGLRIMLELIKNDKSFCIVNVSPIPYETFEITGFTAMTDIRKKRRKISLEGAKEIGWGYTSRVYRLDEDTIVKVYEDIVSIEQIEMELRNAKQAFIAGIPTAISYDIVDVENRLGVVFEMMNGGTLLDAIKAEPERFEEFMDLYVNVLKTLNSTHVEGSFIPKAKDEAGKKLAFLSESILTPEETKKMQLFLDSIPDDDTYVHGDCHVKNIMLSNGEPMLIDVEMTTKGSPLFELGALYSPYVAFEQVIPGNNEYMFGLSPETCKRIFKRVFDCCLPGYCNAQQGLSEAVSLLGCFQCLYIVAKSGNEQNTERALKLFREHL